ncbi:MAG: hypothetical protein IT282_09610 [Bacteroidetes bacterium]|nr:hypothetical protein [Bacteroidota bacterium]
MDFRSRFVFRLLAGLVAIGAAATSPAQVREISVANPGFEDGVPGGIPAGWTLLPGDPSGAAQAGRDASLPHEGMASFSLRHEKGASSTLQSSPVQLSVGKLYRLSAWMRTDNAASDPTSRYPTAVAGTVTMQSFPFTNHAPAAGGTQEWRKSEVLFFATQREDRVCLHLGRNGNATGSVWFDDVRLEEVEDIGAYIPLETVKWFGPAFRYEDKGWIMVHIEGEPYERGYQYGSLLSREIVSYMDKLALRQNGDDPRAGWSDLRMLADAMMLRKYDREYLEEMQGIADGAAKAGAAFSGRPVDLKDIVTVNSAVDIGQLSSALTKTPHALSGRSFKKEEEEARTAERLHKCSSFLANGPATPDGGIVFGQLFMWGGYTGVHWNLICDVVPAKGHRLVYQTFPGGIHSGSDFYINSAGIMMGETTVMQTPYNVDGEPQSSRIRRAAQYASSIDDAVRILTTNNNGLYTNDWLMADTKTGETAILLLGTAKHKLWRSSKNDFPGGTKGFYWSVNNAKDPEVRKEYIPDPSNAPYDIVYGNVNRDLAFHEYYQREKGKIDAISAVNILATSPINRPHACDGKVTTSEMASHLMFLAHYGKVTLREKLVEKNSRLMPDLANAIPHLTLGYTVINPVFVAEQLKGRRATVSVPAKPEQQLSDVRQVYAVEKGNLWKNTVFPASDADNWFVSGTAAYWHMLNALPKDPSAAAVQLRDQLAEMNCRLLYTLDREGPVAPRAAQRVYDRYGHYVIPRIRGTYALHQMRLALGTETFLKVMNGLHDRYREKPAKTSELIDAAEQIAGTSLRKILLPWIERDDLPSVSASARADSTAEGWQLRLSVRQDGVPYAFRSVIAVESEKALEWKQIAVESGNEEVRLSVKHRPARVILNAGNDIPVRRTAYATLSNLFDDFSHTKIVYGTSSQIEANHTLALQYQTAIANQFVEYLLPLVQDAELTEKDLAASDLVILGGPADNALAQRLMPALGISYGKNAFTWKGIRYTDADDGLFVAMPNPYNVRRTVYFLAGNSALQLYRMTKRYQSLPAWAVFKEEHVVEKGYLEVDGLSVPVVR